MREEFNGKHPSMREEFDDFYPLMRDFCYFSYGFPQFPFVKLTKSYTELMMETLF